jgi:hypothetical protein
LGLLEWLNSLVKTKVAEKAEDLIEFELNCTYSLVLSPTHKRTEGRAPVSGSDFTTKAATPQGGQTEITAGLKEKRASDCELYARIPPVLSPREQTA